MFFLLKQIVALHAMFLFLILLFSPAPAKGREGRWEGGLRLGPSFLVENLSDNTKGGAGLLVNGSMAYGLTEKVLLGVDFEWEKHEITQRGADFVYGNESTVSIIPKVEFHPGGEGRISPYLFLGVGMNLNSFTASNDLKTQCPTCELSPGNTLALKGGGGIDYFLLPNLALNGELGLKMNDGGSDIRGNFPGFSAGTSSIDNSLCIFSFILGARYFY